MKGAASSVSNTVSSGASSVTSGAQQATSKAQDTASSGTSGSEEWHAMSEEQKKATYDALPEDKKESGGYMEWIKQGYYNKKENWMPWIEDTYLKWFTNDNKASYATKGKQHCDNNGSWRGIILTEIMQTPSTSRRSLALTK